MEGQTPDQATLTLALSPLASPRRGSMLHAMCKCAVICTSARYCSQTHRLIDSFSDNAFGRIMSTQLNDNQGLTVESCIASCQGMNFTLAGLEFGVQCCKCLITDIIEGCVSPQLTSDSLQSVGRP